MTPEYPEYRDIGWYKAIFWFHQTLPHHTLSNWSRKRRLSQKDYTYVTSQSICQSLCEGHQEISPTRGGGIVTLCKSCNPAWQLERTVWWHDPQLWNFKMWFHVRRCIGDEENLPYCSNNGKIGIHFCFKMPYDIRYIRLEFCRPSSSLIQITPGRSSSVNWKPLAKARHGGRWHGTGIGHSCLEDFRCMSMVFPWYLYGFCVVCL